MNIVTRIKIFKFKSEYKFNNPFSFIQALWIDFILNFNNKPSI